MMKPVKQPDADIADATQTLDARGLYCPLPILKAKKSLGQLESGQELLVFTTDKSARRDFASFCQQSGNALLAQNEMPDGTLAHRIRRR